MRIAALLALAALPMCAASAPSWVREVASKPVPSYPAKVSTVVLLNEEHLTMAADGKRSTRERGAVRILQAGRNSISAFRTYNVKAGRIRDIQGWVIAPNGTETEIRKNQAIDFALSDDYEEVRGRRISFPTQAPAGTVFVWEIVEEEDSIFTHSDFTFQQGFAPVLTARYSVTLPPSWELKSVTFNHDPVQPRSEASTQTWELTNLAPVEDEEYAPYFSTTAPRIGVTMMLSGSTNPALRAMKDWNTVSDWLSAFMDANSAPTDTVAAKAAALTSGAATEHAKIRAIAEFVQKTTYVSVQLNVNKGGGYTPHAPADVLRNNYGDCKDKASLMRAMLKSVGIDSWLVAIYSGSRRHVRPEWPSPLQFNHAIIAVRVSPETKSPAVLEHPKLGRLLIFDPTASKTPVDDIPTYEQGSYALVVARERGELFEVPLLPAESNRVESKIEATLDARAALTAKLDRTYFGQNAALMRSSYEDPKEFRDNFNRSFSRRLGVVSLDKVTGSDSGKSFSASVDFKVQQFGHAMNGRLLMVSPGALLPDTDYLLTTKTRTRPVDIRARTRRESVTMKIPPEFIVDELPDPVNVAGKYGTYKAKWTAKPGELTFEHDLALKDVYAPPAEFAEVKDFFDQLVGAQMGAVVLVNKPGPRP